MSIGNICSEKDLVFALNCEKWWLFADNKSVCGVSVKYGVIYNNNGLYNVNSNNDYG